VPQSKVVHKKVKGGLAGLMKRAKLRGNVQIGLIDAGKHKDGDETVASIGFKHEFGVGVPERSFLRATRKAKQTDITGMTRKLVKAILNGDMEEAKALGLLGQFTADLVKQRIVALKRPPNVTATILAKGSSNPLIDTGQMKNSITYKVNLKGK